MIPRKGWIIPLVIHALLVSYIYAGAQRRVCGATAKHTCRFYLSVRESTEIAKAADGLE